MPEGEEKEQEIENLLEKIMKENFPNLAKEIDFQEVEEVQRVPKKLDPRRKTHNNKLFKIKDKDRLLKVPKRRELTGTEEFHEQRVMEQRSSHEAIS